MSIMKGNRTRKIAPLNMRNEEIQHVIDGYLLQEVLKNIPPQIKIIQACVHITMTQKQYRVVIPNNIKKFGVQSIWESSGMKNVRMVFDKISRAALVHNVKEACAKLNVPFEKAFFKYITLSNGIGTGRFEHCTKEQTPDDTDLRKKLRVLGLIIGGGQVQKLVAEINAKKFRCTIKEEAAKFIMCERA